MSKNNTAAQVTFFGDDVEQVLADNADVRHFIDLAALEIPSALVKVYVYPRPPERPLEWSVSVTSPTGRRTFSVVQRVPLGRISIYSDSA